MYVICARIHSFEVCGTNMTIYLPSQTSLIKLMRTITVFPYQGFMSIKNSDVDIIAVILKMRWGGITITLTLHL